MLRWDADGSGGWTNPSLVDHAVDRADAEMVYAALMEEWSRHMPPDRVRIEIVEVVRHRDYNPDKPG
ncbi:MAG: hypothetical protein KY468_09175 [Armatimonadetes bacterium]|nr:hypothetical protein [Armatimonadota bacterium]